MSELKRCPFCGGEAKSKEFPDPFGDGNTHSVRCNKCKAGLYVAPKNEAIDTWNLRTPEPNTSVIEWHTYDGTPETLPDEMWGVFLAGISEVVALIPDGEWESSDCTFRRLPKVGDRWAYLPQPPEVNADAIKMMNIPSREQLEERINAQYRKDFKGSKIDAEVMNIVIGSGNS